MNVGWYDVTTALAGASAFGIHTMVGDVYSTAFAGGAATASVTAAAVCNAVRRSNRCDAACPPSSRWGRRGRGDKAAQLDASATASSSRISEESW